MKNVKNIIVLSVVLSAVALGACRREVDHTVYEPLKLGAPGFGDKTDR